MTRAISVLCLLFSICVQASAASNSDNFSAPLGLPRIEWPADNPYSTARVQLGKDLFYDGRLSSNGVTSCAFCHLPEHAFSDSAPISTGVSGKLLGRHTPTLINRAWGRSEFWDGRAPTLESQVIIPTTNPDEMNMTADKAVQTLQSIKGYAPLFAAAFGDPTINFDRIAKAVATFERTIVAGDSPYDRYAAGDKSALTKQQKEGLAFFEGKGECAECHNGPNFTNEKFANLGIGMERPFPDPGLAVVTKKKGDFGKFKTPTLRNLAQRAPYMHDGRFKTLGEVLDFYSKGGLPNPHVDSRLLHFYMDAETKRSLLAFLDALNGKNRQDTSLPVLPQ